VLRAVLRAIFYQYKKSDIPILVNGVRELIEKEYGKVEQGQVL
jgi:hypothetical protein